MRRRTFGILVAVLLVASVGCSTPRSRIHGVVKYQGKPLSGGTIVFLPPDNQAYPVAIQPDGSYQIDGVPRGTVRVSVQVEEPRVPPRPAPNLSNPKQQDSFAGGLARADDAGKLARRPPTVAPPPASAPMASALPPRYADARQSGLQLEVTAADQEYSPDLN